MINNAAMLPLGISYQAPGISGGHAAVDKAAKDFESVFLSQMLTHMFEGVGDDDLAGDQNGDDVYKDWMVQQYGKLITDSGGIGVADYVKAEMLKLQEIKQDSAVQGNSQSLNEGVGL
jgi:peptidoglycan hydrolase FlgJ